MDPTTLFIAFGDRTLAGSRIRAWQVCDAWPEAKCVQWDVNGFLFEDTIETIVIQKIHPNASKNFAHDLIHTLEHQKDNGKTLIWDLCDAVWWWMPEEEFLRLAKCFDHIVVANDGLKDTLFDDFQIESTVIVDRLPPTYGQRAHWNVPVPRLVWYGYVGNRGMNLNGVMFVLDRLMRNKIPFQFLVIDDGPGVGSFGNKALEALVEHRKWNPDTFDDDLMTSDIALLPPYPGLWGHVKEPRMDRGHKAATACWAGLAIANGENYQELKRLLLDWKYREERGRINRAWAEIHMDVKQSVVEWKSLITTIKEKKHECTGIAV